MRAFPFLTEQQSAAFEQAVRRIVRDELQQEAERKQRLDEATEPEQAENVGRTLKGRRR